MGSFNNKCSYLLKKIKNYISIINHNFYKKSYCKNLTAVFLEGQWDNSCEGMTPVATEVANRGENKCGKHIKDLQPEAI